MQHETKIRIYFQDTDAGGIVYHANYLDYAERARSEFLYDIGLSNVALIDKGVAFVVRRVEMDFRASARLDDLLTVTTQIIDIKNASMVMEQNVCREGNVLVHMILQLAFIDPKTMRPIRVPTDMKDLFMTYMKSQEEN
jgi:acyl-CoA thioester hydrolase